MSITSLLNRPVNIIHRTSSGEPDEYGNPGTSETVTETVGELQQVRRDEPPAAGETSVTTWLLILPPDTVLTTGDAVDIDEHTYEVTGDPWRARNPRTGQTHHLEATLIRTAGSEDA